MDAITYVLSKKYTDKKVQEIVDLETPFFNHSKNLFNKKTVTKDVGWLYTDGSSKSMPGYSGSDWIPVEPNTEYSQSRYAAIAMYDKNREHIAGSGYSMSAEITTFTTPGNIGFLRVTLLTSQIDVYQLEKGNQVTKYEPFGHYLDTDFIKENSIDHTKVDFIKTTVGKNLFNKNDVEKNLRVAYPQGDLIPIEGVNASHFIRVEPNSTYVRSHVPESWVMYDESFNYIDGGYSTSNIKVFEIPENVRYMRITVKDEWLDEFQFEKGYVSTDYEPYEEKPLIDSALIPPNESYEKSPKLYNQNYWHGKKVVWNGDSITAGFASERPFFADIVAENLGMTSVNYAIGGSTISVKESSPEERNPIVTRFQEMDDDADLIIIAGGTNDHSYSWTPVGTMEDRTNHTFYGALHNLCLGLINKYVGKQIVFMTPIERYRGLLTNEGYSLADYADIIKEVCGYYGIPVLDAYREISLNMDIPAQADALFADTGGHPNQAGHEVMARRITGYLKQLA